MIYINKIRSIYLFVLIGIFGLILAAEAKMVSYIDKNGEMHYVNTDFSKVPAEYKDQVADQLAEANNEVAEMPQEKPEPPNSDEPVVEVLVALDCPDCKKLELLLNAHKIHYQRFDATSHPYGIALYEQIGGMLPITKVNDKVIYGLDIKKIVTAIQEIKKQTKTINNSPKTDTLPELTAEEDSQLNRVQEEKEGSPDAH